MPPSTVTIGFKHSRARAIPRRCPVRCQRVHRAEIEVTGKAAQDGGIGAITITTRDPQNGKDQVIEQPVPGGAAIDMQTIPDLHFLHITEEIIQFQQLGFIAVVTVNAAITGDPGTVGGDQHLFHQRRAPPPVQP